MNFLCKHVYAMYALCMGMYRCLPPNPACPYVRRWITPLFFVGTCFRRLVRDLVSTSWLSNIALHIILLVIDRIYGRGWVGGGSGQIMHLKLPGEQCFQHSIPFSLSLATVTII